ncbi:hypothetical protein BBJ29_001506 [Phytophthora kernoviae]|uniref:Uncharacterized protein n=1 Tax=Phytophthora kernoviae TaxID=325452 RepID=A0A3F2S1P3_9STRA|nr:hypothetical protein BBJ29_001506 [Phytophthora kernoviae]RLN68637.1 hypothetical protein BBP00_00000877 [Phytophthora kernoviae]
MLAMKSLIERELFAGFNSEELAMMQELLRLLVEDDDGLTPQPTPRARVQMDNQALFDGIAGATPKLGNGVMMNDFNDYSWATGFQTNPQWGVAPPMMAPTPQFAMKASRTRTRSNFASDDEPTQKRGRLDVAATMRVPVNRIPLPEGSRVGYSYY